jgi:hypothetical protein
MGISTKLLIKEQKQGLIDVGLNFLSTIMKGLDRGLIKLGPTISREAFEQRITQILQRAENGLPLSPTEQALFGRVVSQVLPDLTKQSFEQSFIPSVREIANTIPSLGEINLLKVLRNPKASDEKVVNALWKAYGGGTKNPLIPNLTKEDLMAFRKMAMNDVRGSVDETPINKLPKPRPTEAEDFVGPTPEEPTPPDETRTDEVLPDETRTDIDNTRYINRELGDIPHITPDEIERLMRLNKGFFKSLEKIRQYIIDSFTRTAQLQDEIALLARNFRDLNPEEQVATRSRIESLMSTISNRNSTAFDEIKTFLQNEIRPYDLTTYSRLSSLDSFGRAEAILSKKSLDEWTKKYGTIRERRAKMWSAVLGEIINPAAWFGKNISKYNGKWPIQVLNKWKDILWSGPEYRELRAYLATGQTKNWEMMTEYAEKMGGFRLRKSVAKELIYNYLLTAVIIAFAKYMRDCISFVLGDTLLADYLDWLADNKENLIKKGVTLDFGSTGWTSLDSIINFVEGTFEIGGDALIRFGEESMNPKFKLPGLLTNFAAFYSRAKKDPTTLEKMRETVNRGDTLVREGVQQTDEFIKKETEKVENIKFKEDKTSFLTWCASKGLLPSTQNSWDDVNKIGTTNDGKQYKLISDGSGFELVDQTPVTTNTEEIKNQLYNHLKTIPSLNSSSTNKIGPNDKPYIFDKGNNLWEFQSAGDSTMKFQYNPQTKTFSQIR